MKTRLTVLFCTLAMVACTYAPTRFEVDPVGRGEFYAHAADHTYEVSCAFGGGSGWAWDEDTLVTNWHVVDGPLTYWVTQGTQHWTVTHIERLPGIDAALVHVDGPLLSVPQRYAGPIERGTFVTMAGFPSATSEVTTTWGYTAGPYSGWEEYVDGSIIPGMSGGPVFDSKGRVIGMNEATTTGYGRPLGIIIPLEEIVNALDHLEFGSTGSIEGGGGRPGDPCPG